MALSEASGETRLPVRDRERVRLRYAERLDLRPVAEREGHLIYRLAQGTFCSFASTGASDGNFTQLALEVSDIDSEVETVRRRGVKFEEFPAFSMTDGIADIGGEPGKGPADRAAWFHDSESNLISLFEFQ